MEITVKFNPSEMKMLKNGETIEVFRFLNPVKLPGGDLWAIHVQKEEKSTDSKYVSTGRSELNRTKEALKVLREGLLNIKLDDLLVSIVRPIDRIIKKSDKILKKKI